MRRMATLLVVTVAAAVAGCGEPEDGGPEATEALVLASCAPSQAPLEVEVCRCAYDELHDRFDAEELSRIDRQLRDDPETVPAAVQEIVLACGFEPVAPPATKPPTTTTTTERARERPFGTTSSSTTSTTDREP